MFHNSRSLCWLISKSPACQNALSLEQKRTAVILERAFEVNLQKNPMKPRLKKKHQVFKVLGQNNIFPPIPSVLLEDVKGIGKKGCITEIKAKIFHQDLFPRGKVLFATPENIEDFGTYYASDIKEEDVAAEAVANELGKLHLRIPMNSQEKWTLSEKHISQALRKMGVIATEEAVKESLKGQTITEPMDIVLQFQVQKFRVKFPCSVYHTKSPVSEDGAPLAIDLDSNPFGSFENQPIENFLEVIETEPETVNNDNNEDLKDSDQS